MTISHANRTSRVADAALPRLR